MKKFLYLFIPHQSNNYHPLALRFRALATYLVFLLAFNVISGLLLSTGALEVAAANIDAGLLVSLANQERASRGLSSLSVDSQLISAAYAKGQDMLAKDYWAHYGPNGESPWQFIRAAGYNYVYAGENLAKDFTTTTPIHNAWMSSESHRANIINSNFRDIGIAVLEGEFQGSNTTIVVQMFGTRAGQSAPAAPTPSTPTTPSAPSSGSSQPRVTDTTPPSAPVITEPAGGSYLNNNLFHTKGEAENGSEVKIFDTDEHIGTLNAEGGAFDYVPEEDYSEGEHVLAATATDSAGNESERSENVAVTVDTIAPEIQKDSLEILSMDIGEKESYAITINVADNANEVKLEFDGSSYDFEHIGDLKWETSFTIDKGILENADYDFTVKTKDLAGNSSTQLIPKSEVLGAMASAMRESEVRSPTAQSSLSSFFSRLGNFDLRKKVNLGFVLFMLFLFALDAFLLWKWNMLRNSSKSLLHVPNFVILLLIGLIGGVGTVMQSGWADSVVR